jgi:hypothetical protein
MIFNKKRPFGAKRKISWLGPDLLAFCWITHKWKEYIGRWFECQAITLKTFYKQLNPPKMGDLGYILTFILESISSA